MIDYIFWRFHNFSQLLGTINRTRTTGILRYARCVIANERRFKVIKYYNIQNCINLIIIDKI